jgi:hypothetical protein
MPRPRSPLTANEIEYIHRRFTYDPEKGEIYRKPGNKSAIRLRADGMLYVTAGSSRNIPAKDVAWFLHTGNLPDSASKVKIIQRETTRCAYELRADNLFLETPDCAFGEMHLRRWHEQEQRIAARANLIGYETSDEARYDTERLVAVAMVKLAADNMKLALSHVELNETHFPSGDTLTEKKIRGHLDHTIIAANEIARVQGWQFDPSDVLRRPDYGDSVDDWLSYYGRVARCTDPAFRHLDADAVLALLAPKSSLFD